MKNSLFVRTGVTSCQSILLLTTPFQTLDYNACYCRRQSVFNTLNWTYLFPTFQTGKNKILSPCCQCAWTMFIMLLGLNISPKRYTFSVLGVILRLFVSAYSFREKSSNMRTQFGETFGHLAVGLVVVVVLLASGVLLPCQRDHHESHT